MAMRAKELGSLGMQVNEKGQVIVAKSSSLVKEFTELVDEAGLKCCICLEGYRNQPNKVLWVWPSHGRLHWRACLWLRFDS